MDVNRSETKRNSGIDLLRVLAMGLIVLHHLLLHGGLVFAFPDFSASGMAVQLLNTVTRCAVNVYALISGYVMVRSRFRPARLMGLWLQVVWTGVLGVVCLPLMGQAISAARLFEALTPVSHDYYWYFTCYAVVFLLSPFLNLLLASMNRKQTGMLIAALTALFSILPTLMLTDRFQLNGGYHPVWLATLYLIGGAVRLHGFERLCGTGRALAAAAICVLAGWAFRLAALAAGWAGLEELLLAYTAPTMLLRAMALLCVFASLKLPAWLGRAASALSPLTFGVYLIHDHPLVREYLLKMKLAGLANLNPVLMLSGLFACWAGVYGLCLALEWMRFRLFAALKTAALCERLEKRILGWTERVFWQADA